MTDQRGSLAGTLSANGILRVAGSASGTLVGLYLVLLQASRIGSAGAGTAGTLGASAYAAELLFSIPLGVLADAWQPRWVMVAGALLGAVAVQFFGLTHNSAILYLSRVLEGISVAAVTPPLLAWLADRTEGDLRARARVMSFFELSVLAGLALAGLRLALRDDHVRRLAPVWLCVNAVTGLWLGPTLAFLITSPSAPHRSQFFDGLYAADPTQFGWVLLGYALLFATGVTGWSMVLARVGVHRAMLISLATMLPVCLGFYLVNHAGGASSGYRWTIGIATALFILVETGFTPAALSWLAGSLHGGVGKGSAMGIYSVLLSVGAIAGSLMAGWLGRLFGFDGLLLGTVLLAVAGLLLITRTPQDTSVDAGETSR